MRAQRRASTPPATGRSRASSRHPCVSPGMQSTPQMFDVFDHNNVAENVACGLVRRAAAVAMASANSRVARAGGTPSQAAQMSLYHCLECRRQEGRRRPPRSGRQEILVAAGRRRYRTRHRWTRARRATRRVRCNACRTAGRMSGGGVGVRTVARNHQRESSRRESIEAPNRTSAPFRHSAVRHSQDRRFGADPQLRPPPRRRAGENVAESTRGTKHMLHARRSGRRATQDCEYRHRVVAVNQPDRTRDSFAAAAMVAPAPFTICRTHAGVG